MTAKKRKVSCTFKRENTLEIQERIYLLYFGSALHTAADRTSPWHEGSQVWLGPALDPIGSAVHAAGEAFFGRFEVQALAEARRQAWLLWNRFQRMLEEERKKKEEERKKKKQEPCTH